MRRRRPAGFLSFSGQTRQHLNSICGVGEYHAPPKNVMHSTWNFLCDSIYMGSLICGRLYKRSPLRFRIGIGRLRRRTMTTSLKKAPATNLRPTTSKKCDSTGTLVFDRGEWVTQAQCRGGDPDALFVRGAEQRKAAAICRACPVMTECLSLIHISEPTRRTERSRMPSSA